MPVILLVLIVLLVVPATAGAQRPAPRPAPLSALPVPGSIVLSNETTITRWAHPAALAAARVRPLPTAPLVTRLRMFTEDGFPEIYLVLRSFRDRRGVLWYFIRVPGRPNGRKAWVRQDSLEPLNLVRTRLIIDRRRLRATLFRVGRPIWTAPVGVGKASSPTPGGRFWIRERLRGDGAVYGAWAFGTSAYSILSDWPGGGVVGIHGTNQPNLVPGRPSHGCVRVHNGPVTRLARLMPLGTPVLIV